jgi:hypothetical protein
MAGSRGFTADLRDHAGELLADGDPVSYEQWRDSLLDLMALLDLEEEDPAPRFCK